jgi:predicted dehydrogenase
MSAELDDFRFDAAHYPEPGPGHVGVVSEFIDAVNGSAWDRHDGHRAANLSHIIGAAYTSARNGHEVDLAD